MSSSKIPDRFNYAEAYLTFECGLGCSYCINKHGRLEKRAGMNADQWVEALNRFDFRIPLTLGGGEPTRHSGFFELLEGLEPKVDLLTNLQFDVNEFIKKVDPEWFTKSDKDFYHPIRASYHSERMDRDDLLARAKRLKNAGFNLGVFGVRHPYSINDNMAMAFKCSQAGVPFYEKDFLGEVDGRTYGFFKYPEGLSGEKKPVKCRTRELLIAPDGHVHRCHRDLYAGEHPIGHISDYEPEDKFRDCANFGRCNPCDLKLKTNKYLEGVECQVEIRCTDSTE